MKKSATAGSKPKKLRTRERILLAAREEMIARGVSGATVDEIVARAGTSKERFYHYFRNKYQIVDVFVAQYIDKLDAAVKFDAHDPLAFVRDLFEFYTANPDEMRLWHWLTLERGQELLPSTDPQMRSRARRIQELRLAQERGLVTRAWAPEILLTLLVALAMAHSMAPQYVNRSATAPGLIPIERQREAVMKAAACLLRQR